MMIEEDFITKVQKGYLQNINSHKTLEEKFQSMFPNLNSFLLKIMPSYLKLKDILQKSALIVNNYDDDQRISPNGYGSSTENSSNIFCLSDTKSMICYDPYYLMSFATKEDLDVNNEMMLNLVLTLNKKGLIENKNDILKETIVTTLDNDFNNENLEETKFELSNVNDFYVDKINPLNTNKTNEENSYTIVNNNACNKTQNFNIVKNNNDNHISNKNSSYEIKRDYNKDENSIGKNQKMNNKEIQKINSLKNDNNISTKPAINVDNPKNINNQNCSFTNTKEALKRFKANPFKVSKSPLRKVFLEKSDPLKSYDTDTDKHSIKNNVFTSKKRGPSNKIIELIEEIPYDKEIIESKKTSKKLDSKKKSSKKSDKSSKKSSELSSIDCFKSDENVNTDEEKVNKKDLADLTEFKTCTHDKIFNNEEMIINNDAKKDNNNKIEEQKQSEEKKLFTKDSIQKKTLFTEELANKKISNENFLTNNKKQKTANNKTTKKDKKKYEDMLAKLDEQNKINLENEKKKEKDKENKIENDKLKEKEKVKKNEITKIKSKFKDNENKNIQNCNKIGINDNTSSKQSKNTQSSKELSFVKRRAIPKNKNIPKIYNKSKSKSSLNNSNNSNKENTTLDLYEDNKVMKSIPLKVQNNYKSKQNNDYKNDLSYTPLKNDLDSECNNRIENRINKSNTKPLLREDYKSKSRSPNIHINIGRSLRSNYNDQIQNLTKNLTIASNGNKGYSYTRFYDNNTFIHSKLVKILAEVNSKNLLENYFNKISYAIDKNRQGDFMEFQEFYFDLKKKLGANKENNTNDNKKKNSINKAKNNDASVVYEVELYNDKTKMISLYLLNNLNLKIKTSV